MAGLKIMFDRYHCINSKNYSPKFAHKTRHVIIISNAGSKLNKDLQSYAIINVAIKDKIKPKSISLLVSISQLRSKGKCV